MDSDVKPLTVAEDRLLMQWITSERESFRAEITSLRKEYHRMQDDNLARIVKLETENQKIRDDLSLVQRQLREALAAQKAG